MQMQCVFMVFDSLRSFM